MATIKEKKWITIAAAGFAIYAALLVWAVAYYFRSPVQTATPTVNEEIKTPASNKQPKAAHQAESDKQPKATHRTENDMASRFAKIKMGMTDAQVVAIMGPGGVSQSGGSGTNLNGSWMVSLRYDSVGPVDYVDTWVDEDGRAYSVGFTSSQVVAKGPYLYARVVNGQNSGERRGGP